MPVFHAAALNRGGSVKGGPYSEGTYPNISEDIGQYSLVTVNVVSTTEIEVTYSGKRQAAAGASTRGADALSETEIVLGPWSTTVFVEEPTAVELADFSPAGQSTLTTFIIIFSALSIISLLFYWESGYKVEDK